jgi:hypothetical protein
MASTYTMDNVQPLGVGIYAEANETDPAAGTGEVRTAAAHLIIPRTDQLPILPDVGNVTDIVSTTDKLPWFDQVKPDLRPEVREDLGGC